MSINANSDVRLQLFAVSTCNDLELVVECHGALEASLSVDLEVLEHATGWVYAHYVCAGHRTRTQDRMPDTILHAMNIICALC